MANTKTTKTVQQEVAIESTEAVKTVETKKSIKTYKANDLITVRSITQGELLLPGKKSQILYHWAAYGDIAEVEYQDLYSLKSSRSQYIYGPLFVIEDEELLSDPRWKDVKAIYDKMYDNEDIGAILRLPIAKFRSVLKQAPSGFLNSIKIEVATKIENGTFDSIQKIKAIDEICGTDFISMIN